MAPLDPDWQLAFYEVGSDSSTTGYPIRLAEEESDDTNLDLIAVAYGAAYHASQPLLECIARAQQLMARSVGSILWLSACGLTEPSLDVAQVAGLLDATDHRSTPTRDLDLASFRSSFIKMVRIAGHSRGVTGVGPKELSITRGATATPSQENVWDLESY